MKTLFLFSRNKIELMNQQVSRKQRHCAHLKDKAVKKICCVDCSHGEEGLVGFTAGKLQW